MVAEHASQPEEIPRLQHDADVAVEAQLGVDVRAIDHSERRRRDDALAIEGHLHLPHANVEIADARPDQLRITDGNEQVRLLIARREAELHVVADVLVEGVALEHEAHPADHEADVRAIGVARRILGLRLGESLELRANPDVEDRAFVLRPEREAAAERARRRRRRALVGSGQRLRQRTWRDEHEGQRPRQRQRRSDPQ